MWFEEPQYTQTRRSVLGVGGRLGSAMEGSVKSVRVAGTRDPLGANWTLTLEPAGEMVGPADFECGEMRRAW